MEFTTLNNYITRYKNMINKESSFSYSQWLYDTDLIEEDEILNKNIDYFKVLEENIIDKHSYYIDKYLYNVKLTEEQYRKYRCNAHRLAYDIFGSTAFWFLILNANQLYSESEFDMHTFKMYRPDVISHLSEMRIVESDLLDKNKADVARMANSLKVFFADIEKDENELHEYDIE